MTFVKQETAPEVEVGRGVLKNIISTMITGTKLKNITGKAKKASVLPRQKVSFQSFTSEAGAGVKSALDKLAEHRNKTQRMRLWAKLKFADIPKIHALSEEAQSKHDFTMSASYQNTLRCMYEVRMKDGSLKSTYCNQRWCKVCSRLRTAKLINRYEQHFKTLKDPYLVTLTIVNTSGGSLRNIIFGMGKTFRMITDLARKKGKRLVGVRTIETTYSTRRNDFHPHYHVIVDGKENAEFLYSEWIKRNPTSKKKAQNIRKADINSLKEVFKYATKEVEYTKTGQKKPMQIHALHVIYSSMRSMRTFQPIGNFGKGELDKLETEALEDILMEGDEALHESIHEKSEGVFTWHNFDWVNTNTGETLSDYIPTSEDVRNSNHIKRKHEPPDIRKRNIFDMISKEQKSAWMNITSLN